MKKIQKSNIYVVIPIAKRMYLTGVGVKRGAGWGNIRRRPGQYKNKYHMGGCDIYFYIALLSYKRNNTVKLSIPAFIWRKLVIKRYQGNINIHIDWLSIRKRTH